MTENELSRLESLVAETAKEIAQNTKAIAQNTKDIAELKVLSQRWDERFYQFTKDTLGTSNRIIVTAGVVVILSPVLQALAPAVEEVVARLLDLKP